MAHLKDLSITLFVGLLFGGLVVLVTTLFGMPVPAPEHRPVFLIGSALLAFCFRLLMGVREEE